MKNNENLKTEVESMEEKLVSVTVQGVENFKLSLNEILNMEDYELQEDPNEVLAIEDPIDAYEYIMNHDYWVREWANFLVHQITGLVFEDIRITR